MAKRKFYKNRKSKLNLDNQLFQDIKAPSYELLYSIFNNVSFQFKYLNFESFRILQSNWIDRFYAEHLKDFLENQKKDEYESSDHYISQSKKKFENEPISTWPQRRQEEAVDHFISVQKNSETIILEFMRKMIQEEFEGFKKEKTYLYKKITNTFEVLSIDLKYVDSIYFTAILSMNRVLKEWLDSNLESEDIIHGLLQKTNLLKSDFYYMQSDESKFVQFDIIESNSSRRFFPEEIELSNSFKAFLIDEQAKTFGMTQVKKDTSPSKTLDSFFMPEEEKNTVLKLLSGDKPTKILFHGSPGSGKTEFVRSLVNTLGKTLYKIDSPNAEDKRARRAALVVGDSLISDKESILLVDESDDLLNEGGGGFSFFRMRWNQIPEKKIWMNDFLDNVQGKVIFITNESHSIHESVKRRFDYNIEFSPAEEKQRAYYWKSIAFSEKVSHLFDDTRINEYAERYSIGVGGITIAIQAVKKIQPNIHRKKTVQKDTYDKFHTNLKDILKRHVQLIGSKVNKPKQFNTAYDPTILNVDKDLTELERLVEEYSISLKMDSNSVNGSLCLLFYGSPGTGKTEYAKYLSKKLDIELYQKRYSDLQSPYIGECEKNIADAFAEAERKKAIFFLDEADSFFRSRETAQRSWEIAQTNEFLTWMETFQGIFIASTNFMKDFDPAAMRRFAWKGEFKSLRREDKVSLVIKYFPFLSEKLNFLDQENIKEIPDLTPGDIRAVWNQFRYRDPATLQAEDVIQGLISEVSFKSNTKLKAIGF